MKKYNFYFFLLLILSSSNNITVAQTGIGTTTPDASAKLEVSATNKGFLPPRVTLTGVTDATTIPSPATGLLVYNTGTNVNLAAGYYYWNGANWATIATASSPNQTVDFVSVTKTSAQTVNSGDNILFNQTNGGNIPYNSSTGAFTLIAGKTYRMTGYVALSSANSTSEEVNVVWKTGTGDILSNKGDILSTNMGTTAASAGVADVIYTPPANTTVTLNVQYSSGNSIIWSQMTYAIIQQIGSSAIINPWVLNGNNVYNTTGNVGIGTNAPDASALLDLTSTTQGISFPSMTSAQRTAIVSPKTGLQVFDTTTNSSWYFDGTSWVNTVSVASFGDVKTGFQTVDHNGWIKLDGRAKSSLSQTQQIQANNLGIGTNLPNASNAYLSQNGSTVGSVSGSNTKSIARANLPDVTLTGTTNTTGNHTHGYSVDSSPWAASGNSITNVSDRNNDSSKVADSYAGNHSHTVTTSSINGGVTQQAFNVAPLTLSVNVFIYLGY